MNALEQWNLISEAEYLAGELSSPVKHEYVGGVIHAMTGARVVHNVISGNIFATLHAMFRRKPCRAFNSDMKIRIRSSSLTRYYYPDVSVVCRSNGPQENFQDEPTILVEVLSKSTRRIDTWEKKEAYLTIPSLQLYLMVDQASPAVIAYRRTSEGFVRETHTGIESVVPLPKLSGSVEEWSTGLALADVYEAVEFVPEPSDEEEI
jgi:Uma2 family endonuclease